jgi:hypothetical protein
MATRAAYYGDKPVLADATQGAAVTDVGALTSVVAAGATPTKAEYDALRVDVASNRTKINALLASLRAAGLIDT